jgi:hypothetical protein
MMSGRVAAANRSRTGDERILRKRVAIFSSDASNSKCAAIFTLRFEAKNRG